MTFSSFIGHFKKRGLSLLVAQHKYLTCLKTSSSSLHILQLIRTPSRVVNGPISSGPSPAQTRKYKPEPGPNQKANLNPKSYPKKNGSQVGSEKLSNVAKLF